MAIIPIKDALERDLVSTGAVYVKGTPQVRNGKRGEFMVGQFMQGRDLVDFKIWESSIFLPVAVNGPGVYEAQVQGSEFQNQKYLTVQKIEPQRDPDITYEDFLPSVPRGTLDAIWPEVKHDLLALGLDPEDLRFLLKIVNDDRLGRRFTVEGAAMNRHDNQIGGLAHHTFKMLRILVALLKNNPELQAHITLLTFGVLLHDIGKVFEYHNLELGEYWYAHHRIRGIEFLCDWREELIARYGEAFYRQLQSIISGHHGEFGDRPTTIAAGIIHYIDTIESQVTGLLEDWYQASGDQLYVRDWGYLAGFPKAAGDEPQDDTRPEEQG